MRKYLRAAAVMVGVMASGGAWADDDGDGGEGTELPEAVVARLKSELPTVTIASATRRGDGWAASLRAGLRRQDVLLDQVGNVVERHEAISVRELPEEVRASLAKTHPRHTLWRANRITTGDEVFHEVLLARGDRRSTVVFAPDGRPLAGATTG
jgi:hypothetical protein